ncbi:hypothetical protein HHK36_005470 [Tetracentron sinense]|uniref:Uncharacterized protein n=1 Tax=Tetracentron sinense TaxID=13715 RepID=A0A834ZPG7_TETSI|nr:hypothetical protein HHK36_005470 [Tetracentron sinense]
MVRFSCFHAHIHSHKSKKPVQQSAEAMHTKLQESSQNQAMKVSGDPTSLNTLLLNAHEDIHSNTSAEQVTSSSSLERFWKSEEMNSSFSPGVTVGIHQTVCLKKSQSLGNGMDRKVMFAGGIDTEEEIDQGFACHDYCDQNGSVGPFDSKDTGTNLLNQYHEALGSESFLVSSDPVPNETIFSIGDAKPLEREGHEDFNTQLSGELAGDCGDHMHGIAPMMAKSCSSPNLGAYTPTSGEGSPSHVHVEPRCRSTEDLSALDIKRKEFLYYEVRFPGMVDQEGDDNIFKTGKDNCENHVGGGSDSYNYLDLAKDWIIPGMDEVGVVKNLQGESSTQQWDELASKEFKFKRIEEWVIDLQHCSPLQETGEPSHSKDQVKKGPIVLDSLTTAKLDAKFNPGMETAKKYISSLSATTSSAQLANHGLVVIPFLSAFVSLRALNLSGNAIVRITAGALPRGLHTLNLSKNNISTIEGLRELTRLRVLDLSYNRIFRIGHGLAYCSSLKELYLAGNKINEVEGLHRLLKLNVLDLRFNKISTAKCLGQLAANYSSLQAISLEGNPAQRNVGDEQLKKHLQGLVPHLAYFNRQPIKVSTLKEVADRPVRSAITTHQFDRGLRSEHKSTRKGSHSVATHKPSSSLSHGRKSHAVERSKDRHGRLPPSGTKGTTQHQHNFLDSSNKLLRFQSNLSMRRSRSEGTLGAS